MRGLVFLFVGILAMLATPAAALLFGPTDDRRPAGADESGRVGLVVAANGSGESRCTGALVGPRHVITNAHCLFERNGALISRDVRFFPDPRQGDSIGTEDIVVGSRIWTDLGNDWAILVLDAPPPGSPGYFPVYAPVDWDFFLFTTDNFVGYGRDARLVAYHGDVDGGATLSVSSDCGVRGEPNSTLTLADGNRIGAGNFFHDCDATPISSGGPLLVDRFGVPTVIGVQSSFAARGTHDLYPYSEPSGTFNIGVKASRFQDTLERLLGR